jgi:hypothetical protein
MSAVQAALVPNNVGNQKAAHPPFNSEETQSYVQEDNPIFIQQADILFQVIQVEAKVQTRSRYPQQSRWVQQRRARQRWKRELGK